MHTNSVKMLTFCLSGSSLSVFMPNQPLFFPLTCEFTAYLAFCSIGDLKNSWACKYEN